MVPTVVLPPAIPSTFQATSVVTTPLRNAVYCCVCACVSDVIRGFTDTGAGFAPVPVMLTDWMLAGSTSATLIQPGRAPLKVGVNVTLIVQEPPTATEVPQSLVCA